MKAPRVQLAVRLMVVLGALPLMGVSSCRSFLATRQAQGDMRGLFLPAARASVLVIIVEPALTVSNTSHGERWSLLQHAPANESSS